MKDLFELRARFKILWIGGPGRVRDLRIQEVRDVKSRCD